MPAGGMLIGSVAAPLIGGIVGNLMGAEDREQAALASQKALEAIMGVSLPTIEEQKIALEKLTSSGKLTPEMLATITQGNSELSTISTDPRLQEAQMNALTSLSQRGEEGLTASDRVALNTTRRDTNRDVNGRNQAILQNMQQRGMGGSGSELAAQLMNSQEGADRASQESDRLAAMAQQNALQATINSGQLGGQIRNQEYGEKSAAAQAQDAINRFNATNSQNVAATNVTARNDAQKSNLANDQRISDANVGLSNQQTVHNKGLIQQDYTNRLNQAKSVADAQNNKANVYNQQATASSNMATGIGQGVGQAAGAVASYQVGQDANALKDRELKSKGYAHGGMIDGPELVSGDNSANDVVPILASGGEVMIPKSIVNSSDEAILDFIRHVKRTSKK